MRPNMLKDFSLAGLKTETVTFTNANALKLHFALSVLFQTKHKLSKNLFLY